MSSICLNMIVKDEADIIEATLENILQYIDISYWVIADTGSTDNTPALIEQFFQKHQIEGKLLHHQWKNFGENRQLALEQAQGLTDYVFFFDADDRFEGDFRLSRHANLDCDAYEFKMCNQTSNSHTYFRKLLVKNNGDWYWQGVIHEQIVTDKPEIRQMSINRDYCVISGRFGARSKNPNRYLEDAKTLEKAFVDTDNAELKLQYAYFCGQSYRDAQKSSLAIFWFKQAIKRCKYGSETRRYSLVSLGNEYKRINQIELALNAWLQAYDNSPQNAEAAVILSEYFFNQNCPQLAFDFAQKSLAGTYPDQQDAIAIDTVLYQYGRYNALLRASLELKKYDTAYFAWLNLLNEPELNQNLNDYLMYVCSLPEIKALFSQESAEKKQQILENMQNRSQLSEQGKAYRFSFLAEFAKNELEEKPNESNSS